MALKFYDFFTIWSLLLFIITLILIFVDLFVDYLPGWWITWIFANTIVMGIVGTILGTFSADALLNSHYSSVNGLAGWQFILHFAPMLIVFFLLLLFPNIIKEWEVWQVAVAEIIFIFLYLVTPKSGTRQWFNKKVAEVYLNPNQWLLSFLFIGTYAFVVYVLYRLQQLVEENKV